MSMYPSIKARLKTAEGVNKVDMALNLTNAYAQSTRVDVAVYITPLAEKASANTRISGPVLQEVTDTFGVLFSIRTTNDKSGERSLEKLQTVRQLVRQKLLGWMPEGATHHCEMAGGDLARMDKGQVWWLDKYTTKHQEKSGI